MKMLLFFLLLFIQNFYLHAECNVKGNKVVIFVNTNNADGEIEAAKRGACARNEQLMVVPEVSQEYKDLVGQKRRLKIKLRKCPNDECYSKVRTEFLKIDEKIEKLPKVNLDNDFGNALKRLKKDNKKVSSMIISGHNGGGGFGGDFAQINRADLEKNLLEFSDLFKETGSLLLLGCYSLTQSEVLNWKTSMPQLKLLAGYDNSAPLKETLSGHKYLEDVLTHEKEIITTSKDTALKKMLFEKLRDVKNIAAAMYIQATDKCHSTTSEYYFSSLDKTPVKKFDATTCLEVNKKLPYYMEIQNQYLNGAKDIPKITSGTDLRELYTFVRQNDFCFQQDDDSYGIRFLEDNRTFYRNGMMKADNLLMLLFYHEVLKNYEEYFSNDLEWLNDTLKNLDLNEINKAIDKESERYESRIKRRFREDLFTHKYPDEYQKSLKNKIEFYDSYISQLKESNPDIKKYLDKMQGQRDFDIAMSIREDLHRYEQTPLAVRKADLHFLSTVFISKTFLNDDLQSGRENFQDGERKLSARMNQTIQNARNYASEIMVQKIKSKQSVSEVKQQTSDGYLKELGSKSRGEILEKVHQLTTLQRALPMNSDQREKLEEQKDRMEMILVQLQCLPFDWHEYSGNRPTHPPEQCLERGRTTGMRDYERMMRISRSNTTDNDENECLECERYDIQDSSLVDDFKSKLRAYEQQQREMEKKLIKDDYLEDALYQFDQ